ncbi:MAG TPA: hypothetical protein PL032_06180 [Syntrophorhabdus sp.]|nr:hypothetical protein [Syntrophorhabdus sp.]MDI9558056.1 hypothetical protein [Pseudomonadota bacterium]HOH26550.1 hypothetical protein [Syntrophorhabdus sp.]HPW35630.1 hypothetical protein [Syntrophorhabdus sp.]HQH82136.1 hypothetical protein [Syntrophorhabdus sp.]
MSTLEEDEKSKGNKGAQYKSWLFIISFMIFFFLIGLLVKWFSANSHSPH